MSLLERRRRLILDGREHGGSRLMSFIQLPFIAFGAECPSRGGQTLRKEKSYDEEAADGGCYRGLHRNGACACSNTNTGEPACYPDYQPACYPECGPV